MTNPVMWFLFLFVSTDLPIIVQGQSNYKHIGEGLILFPHDIPDDVVNITLNNNRISEIDYIEAFVE